MFAAAPTKPLPKAAPQKGRIPLPRRLLVLPWGESQALDGSPVIVDDLTLSVFAANMAKARADEIALDFQHGTHLADSKPEPQGPVKVAAYGTCEVVSGEGIYFCPTVWTPEGEESFTGRHYRDLSPTPFRDDAGRVVALHSIALCRMGQIAGLHAFGAPVTAGATPLSTDATTMDPEQSDLDFRSLLISLLGLNAETATDEDIVSAAQAKAAGEAEAMAVPEKPATPCAADPMAARFDALERELIVTQATSAGKIIPLAADAIAALTPAQLRATVAAIEPTVPLKGSTPANEVTPGPKPLSADEKEVCRQLGISEEQFRKK
jgi:phage I-like protein